MAFLFIRAKILKASSGKSVVAAAAYQSAQRLRDESLGMTFQYRHKEEVVFSEILLPDNAPAAYQDRETLWNAVAAKERSQNSQVARQFIVAMPKEWTEEESIERARAFIQKYLVDEGMAVDWAFHKKENNPHIHCLCSLRGFNKDGSWALKEKKVFALDDNGERIPEIDSKTGEQKVRIRKRNGNVTTEKIWKRITVDANSWNSRQFLSNIKKQWVEHCNYYLQGEDQIDNRSTHEQKCNRIPLLHEGPEARSALERGVVFDVVKENQERRQINLALDRMDQIIRDAKIMLAAIREKFNQWRERHEQRRSVTAVELIERYGRIAASISGISRRDVEGTNDKKSIDQWITSLTELSKKADHIQKQRHR